MQGVFGKGRLITILVQYVCLTTFTNHILILLEDKSNFCADFVFELSNGGW